MTIARTLLGGVVILLVVVVIAVALFARGTIGSAAVKRTLEQQLSARLGEPVRIDTLGASFFPRVTLDMRNVSIGDPAKATIAELSIATGLRGLLSKRIEDGEIILSNSRVPAEMVLGFAGAAASGGSARSQDGLTIVSIRIPRTQERSARRRHSFVDRGPAGVDCRRPSRRDPARGAVERYSAGCSRRVDEHCRPQRDIYRHRGPSESRRAARCRIRLLHSGRLELRGAGRRHHRCERPGGRARRLSLPEAVLGRASHAGTDARRSASPGDVRWHLRRTARRVNHRERTRSLDERARRGDGRCGDAAGGAGLEQHVRQR